MNSQSLTCTYGDCLVLTRRLGIGGNQGALLVPSDSVSIEGWGRQSEGTVHDARVMIIHVIAHLAGVPEDVLLG